MLMLMDSRGQHGTRSAGAGGGGRLTLSRGLHEALVRRSWRGPGDSGSRRATYAKS